MKSKEPFRASGRCNAKTKGGRQCGRIVVHGPRCWMHGQSIDGLRIKPSKIPNAGRGLFAAKEIPKDRIVSKFKGPTIDEKTVESYTPAHQAECVEQGRGKWLDFSKTNSCFARYANEAPKRQDINADMVLMAPTKADKPPKPALEAKKTIHIGDEVETDYGQIFDRPYPHWRRSTSNYERSRARTKK